jgi:hypothetical protein
MTEVQRLSYSSGYKRVVASHVTPLAATSYSTHTFVLAGFDDLMMVGAWLPAVVLVRVSF